MEYISPDTLKDDQKAASGRPDDTYYRVLILTDKSTLHAGNKDLPIIPAWWPRWKSAPARNHP